MEELKMIHETFELALKELDEDDGTKYNKIMQDLFSVKTINVFSIANAVSFLKDLPIVTDINKLNNNFMDNINILFKKLEFYAQKPESDQYKCLSCIYGAFLGDATGAYCEFRQSNENNAKDIFQGKPPLGEAPGQVTDDSEMAMSLAYAIMDTPYDYLNIYSEYLYYFYGCWYFTSPLDIGNTTINALSLFNFKDYKLKNCSKVFNEIKELIKGFNYSSLANGFLMRISPFIAWFYYINKNNIKSYFYKESNKIHELYFLLKKDVSKDNICTHPNPECASVSAIFILLVLGTLVDKKQKETIDIITKMFLDKNKFNKEEDIKAFNVFTLSVALFSDKKFDRKDYFTKVNSVYHRMGFYEHAFKLAIYYFINLDEFLLKQSKDNNYNCFKEIMCEICNYGGDTDTNCAIVGTLIGPLIGYNNFNQEFLTMVNFIPSNRTIYSPIFMVCFIEYLENMKTNKIKPGHHFLKMIFELLHGKMQ